MTDQSARDTAVYELRDALTEPGCPICLLALRSVGRFIQATAYDRVTDVDLRAHLRAARGFCGVHAYRWLREARNVLGTAQIYRDIIKAASADDLSSPAIAAGWERLKRLAGRPAEITRPTTQTCLACDAQHEAEDRYLDALEAFLHSQPGAREAFEASDGLCLPHIQRADAGGSRGRQREVLSGRARRRAESLMAMLDEVIRKEDYRFRHEERTADERRATADAVAWINGADGLVD